MSWGQFFLGVLVGGTAIGLLCIVVGALVWPRAAADTAAFFPVPPGPPAGRDNQTPDPDRTPMPTPVRLVIGEEATIFARGEPWATVTVLDVREVASYPHADSVIVPEDPEKIFLAVELRYEAIADDVNYGSFDWQLYLDDRAYEVRRASPFTPEGQIASNSMLPPGRHAEGVVLFEVAPEGEIVMTYVGQHGNVEYDEPLPEWVIRSD